MAGALARLDLTADDKRRARDAVLGLLARKKVVADLLAGALAWLDPTADDKRRARDAVLGLLARKRVMADQPAGALARLDPTADGQAQWCCASSSLPGDREKPWEVRQRRLAADPGR